MFSGGRELGVTGYSTYLTASQRIYRFGSDLICQTRRVNPRIIHNVSTELTRRVVFDGVSWDVLSLGLTGWVK